MATIRQFGQNVHQLGNAGVGVDAIAIADDDRITGSFEVDALEGSLQADSIVGFLAVAELTGLLQDQTSRVSGAIEVARIHGEIWGCGPVANNEIIIYRGETKRVLDTISETPAGQTQSNVFDLTGSTVRAALKNIDGTQIGATLTSNTAGEIDIPTPTNGQAIITIPPATTNQTPGEYRFSVWVDQPNNGPTNAATIAKVTIREGYNPS